MDDKTNGVMKNLKLTKKDCSSFSHYSQEYMDRPFEAEIEGANIPAGVPQTIEQALADIEENEKQFEQGNTCSHEQVMQMVLGKIYNYAN